MTQTVFTVQCSARVLTITFSPQTHTLNCPNTASRNPKTARPRACLPRVYPVCVKLPGDHRGLRTPNRQRTPSTSVSVTPESHVRVRAYAPQLHQVSRIAYRRSGDRVRDSCAGASRTALRRTALHATGQVWLFQPAIATDNLAACSCFQKRLRQLVNLSKNGKGVVRVHVHAHFTRRRVKVLAGCRDCRSVLLV